jgi:nucleoid DNA-binding protein
MNKKKVFRNQRISHYSKEPTSNFKAIQRIASDMNLPPVKVKQYVDAFFGKYGIKYFIKLGIEISIYGFGKFYFHKKVYNEKLRYKIRRKFENKNAYKNLIEKYKMKLK